MDLSDLQDDEIVWIRQLAHELTLKWSRKPNNQNNLQEMCREAKGKAQARGIIIDWDLIPVISGRPPVLVVIGKNSDHENKYGFDHEKKRHDVLKSKIEKTEDRVK